MAKIPYAGTGILLGRNLNEMWTRGKPSRFALELYSNSQPSLTNFETPIIPALGKEFYIKIHGSTSILKGKRILRIAIGGIKTQRGT